MLYYIVRVPDISENGKTITASYADDNWFTNLIKDAITADVNSTEATFSATISKVERSLEIIGGIYLKLNVACSRCMSDFDFEQQIPFRFLLEPAPKAESSERGDDAEDMSEVVDFSYYSGDEFDLGDLIRQYVLMAQPISYFCKDECKGLCHKCGKNLNEGVCDCVEDHSDSPFAVLKQLKQ